MSPNLELQGAIVATLKSAAPVTALIGARVYDYVPRDPTGALIATAQMPFVAISASDDLQNDADCISAVDVTISLDVWSKEPGSSEIKKIAEAVRAALHGLVPTLATNAAVELNHVQTRHESDPSGPWHSIIEFAATIEIN